MVTLLWQRTALLQLVDGPLWDANCHYLPCERLPLVDGVERIVAEHRDVVAQIRNVNPDRVDFRVDTWTCPGRADVRIEYPRHSDRVEIEKIIDADTFFGVPYRLTNY